GARAPARVRLLLRQRPVAVELARLLGADGADDAARPAGGAAALAAAHRRADAADPPRAHLDAAARPRLRRGLHGDLRAAARPRPDAAEAARQRRLLGQPARDDAVL